MVWSLCLRVRKLKETLVMVQQLDKNMSNLRTWLSHIEGELIKPIVFGVCHGDEIQCKLAEQQVHTHTLLVVSGLINRVLVKRHKQGTGPSWCPIYF